MPSCDLGGALIRERLEKLPEHLRTLAAALAKIPVSSERIFLVGYPDPTQDKDGSHCDREPIGDLLAGIEKAESRWVAEEVLPRLNGMLCEAASKHGWTYVGGAAGRFEGARLVRRRRELDQHGRRRVAQAGRTRAARCTRTRPGTG